MEDVKKQIDLAEDAMAHAVDHLDKELSHIKAGKAHTSMVDGVQVDYYGSHVPIAQVANLSTGDARTILIKPWEKNMLHTIERALLAANLGITPQNDGETIRLTIPILTEQRRKDLVKQVKNYGEDSKVGVRNARKKANEELKKLTKSGLSEDELKSAENKVQVLTDKYVADIEKIVSAKEKELLTI